MGAGVSAGECNDDLIDNLMEADYIKTPAIERVFRAVDRGAYYLSDLSVHAYRDVAWKHGNFHISAPCIYSEVMEGLRLRAGMSFLNLGSGTGYLNTMAGLLLGHNGTNHGIELHDDLVQYSIKKLEEFKKLSGAIDEYDFCEPKFMTGNCLSLASGGHLYDRAYCGAACPEPFLNYVKTLIRQGGVIIIPINEQLVELTRLTETSWASRSLLPVSFATLVPPPEGNTDLVKLYDVEPLSLQEICRASVRTILRRIIQSEHPEVRGYFDKGTKKKKKGSKRRSKKTETPKPATEELFDYLLSTVAHQKSVFQSAMRHRLQYDRNLELQRLGLPPEPIPPIEMNPPDTESSSESEEEAAGEHVDPLAEPMNKMQDVFMEIIGNLSSGDGNGEAGGSNSEEATTSSSSQRSEEGGGGNCKTETVEAIIETPQEKTEEMVVEDADGKRKEEEISGSSSAPDAKRRNNRDKFDSGLGDELFCEIPGPDNMDLNVVETVSSGSSDEDSKKLKAAEDPDEIGKSDSVDDVSQSEDDNQLQIQNKMYNSPYTPYMKSKIAELPLPSVLKDYLNYYREF